MNGVVVAIVLAIVSGALAAVQPPINTVMASTLKSAVTAALISFSLGATVLFFIALVMRERPDFAAARALPSYMWLGGLCGIGFVASAPYVVSRVGISTTMTLFILGQLLMSIALDHFGTFGVLPRPINIGRLAGLASVIFGVYLVRRN
jgi:bacterial/archaeal transporter family-2 protein